MNWLWIVILLASCGAAIAAAVWAWRVKRDEQKAFDEMVDSLNRVGEAMRREQDAELERMRRRYEGQL